MYCSQFRNHYSDYRDDRIPDARFRREMQAHLQACLECAGFDRTLDRGVSLIYRSGEILVPPGFKNRILRDLQKRQSNGEPVTPAPAGYAAAAMVVAALALVFFRPETEPEPVAGISVPAAEVRLPQLIAPPQSPQVDFTEFELPNPPQVFTLPDDEPREIPAPEPGKRP